MILNSVYTTELVDKDIVSKESAVQEARRLRDIVKDFVKNGSKLRYRTVCEITESFPSTVVVLESFPLAIAVVVTLLNAFAVMHVLLIRQVTQAFPYARGVFKISILPNRQ